MTAAPAFHARFAGLDWSGDLPFAQFDPTPDPAPGAVMLGRREASRIGAPLCEVGRARIAADGVRFDCGDEVHFDCEDGARIGWVPGPQWRGALPTSFYSSVAAITLAMRGMVPLHASAVILHDRAWLLAGPSGAGKSTLTAELLGAGALLLADDLTALTLAPHPVAWRGRPAMRLHPTSCEHLTCASAPEPTDDPRGKLLVRPAARAEDRGWPVGGLLLLGEMPDTPASPGERAVAFGSTLFRPRILTALPQRSQLRASLLALARDVPMALMPTVRGFDAATRSQRVAHTLSCIESLASRAFIKSS